jgi:hypothetical protein
LQRTEVVRLPSGGIGIEAPTDLTGGGPVLLDGGRQLRVEAELVLDVPGLRYKVRTFSVRADDGDEINPDLLRQLHWAEMFAAGVENVSRVVTFGADGTETRHRSLLTLTPDEQTAGLWLQARLAGEDPNKYISEQLGITAMAAATRVKRLRDAKILPPTSQGRRR